MTSFLPMKSGKQKKNFFFFSFLPISTIYCVVRVVWNVMSCNSQYLKHLSTQNEMNIFKPRPHIFNEHLFLYKIEYTIIVQRNDT